MTAHQDIAEIIRSLDKIGFDFGAYHISVYRALLMLVVAVVVIVLGQLASALIGRAFRRMHRLDAAQQVLGEKLASLVAWVVLVLVGIDFLGISLTALTVFSGALGLAIGFGLQKTFGNLISGIILLMDRSIKPGDVIAVGEGTRRTVGQVNRVGIRAVSVVTRDRVEFLIPNEQLMTATVENWSFSSRDVRVQVPVKVDNSSEIGFVEGLMLQAARSHPRALARHQPEVWLTGFDENAIHFEIQVWIEDPEDGLGNLQSDILKQVWRLFRENGVKMPFPQHDIAIKEWPEGTKFS